MEMLESSFLPAVNPDDRWPLLEKYRAAIGKQLLTPAPVKWKQMALAGDNHRCTGVRTEWLERAIAEDLEFLAVHPCVNQAGGRQS
jgi:hypothetical protein